MKKTVRLILLGLFVAIIALLFRPVLHLWTFYQIDPKDPLPPIKAGYNDQSRLNPNVPAEVVTVANDRAAAEVQLGELVQRADRERRRISISGAGHSMGGHTFYPGGLVLDMRPFALMELDEANRILTVGAGATWAEVIPFLDHQGLSVAIMQSNNDFTVGGSLSVNCHGWQYDSPPIASTVDSFRLITANGEIVTCSRHENPELFSLALGGYGLFGIILDARLRVVPNEYYRAEAFRIMPQDYAESYLLLTRSRDDVGLAYGRISVAPDFFFNEASLTLLARQKTDQPLRDTLTPQSANLLKRLVFRGSVGNDYGKNLRWQLETLLGETAGRTLSRNQIMNEPSKWFANRDASATDVIQEYFIPPSRMGDFIDQAKSILLRRKPDLLNLTVRKVQADPDTFLKYARKDVFGLVMLFNQSLDTVSDQSMGELNRELIDAALACEGTYYLPYRPHATLKEFAEAYPMQKQFFALKHKYDPSGVFENSFSKKYGSSDE